MTYIGHTTPKILISDEGKHIRDINDIYTSAEYDKEGNIIKEEHLPYYSTIIFLADNFDENKLNELYIEEKIEKE